MMVIGTSLKSLSASRVMAKPPIFLNEDQYKANWDVLKHKMDSMFQDKELSVITSSASLVIPSSTMITSPLITTVTNTDVVTTDYNFSIPHQNQPVGIYPGNTPQCYPVQAEQKNHPSAGVGSKAQKWMVQGIHASNVKDDVIQNHHLYTSLLSELEVSRGKNCTLTNKCKVLKEDLKIAQTNIINLRGEIQKQNGTNHGMTSGHMGNQVLQNNLETRIIQLEKENMEAKINRATRNYGDDYRNENIKRDINVLFKEQSHLVKTIKGLKNKLEELT